MSKLFLWICTASFFLVACEKKTTAVLSSGKTISSVLFRAADNPGLTADVAGALQADTIKASLPYPVSLTRLVPYIFHSGESISPSNRTAQDFTHPVTYTVTAEDGTTRTYVFSITREQADTLTLLSGRWSVIRDSVSNVGGFYFNSSQGTMFPISGVYYGTAQDYWSFTISGTFSMLENGITGTVAYRLLPDHKLDIEGWTVHYGAATIEKLNPEAATFVWTNTSANGGQYYRKAYLKK